VARIDRRTFLAAATAAAFPVTVAPRLETLTDWVKASRAAREQALKPTLDRIAELDEAIHAWIQVAPQKPTGDGPLGAIPFGAKDIIETRGLLTTYGSPIYKDRVGTFDADIVRMLRARGAVLLGKTHSTGFAYRTPGPTRNPRDLAHTPGGSSSGSAAAVAAGMVPIAIGTQTRGSILRPASYCGVTGFKASFGLLPMNGVLPLARSLDTLGFFTHTPADMLVLWKSIGQATGRPEDVAIAAPNPIPDVEPPMAQAFNRALAALGASGVTIAAVDIAAMLEKLSDAGSTVMFYEGARFHEQRYNQYGDRLADIADLVREGLRMPAARYEDARRYIADCKVKMTEIYKATPIVLVPAATGPAPLGLASTGDARMNGPWTALGTPAISIPLPVAGGLPLGLQVTADHGQDARVIRAAMRLHGLLHAGS